MILKSGAYKIEERSLHFDLAADLEFSRQFNCYTFTGGNGYGKTSFIEHIIIPALKENNIDYLYLGQDIRNQLYTIKALLSVRGYKVSSADESTLLQWWLELGRSASVLILDEFDKYFSDVKQIFSVCNSFIRTYIAVTHLGSERINPDSEKYITKRRHFDLAGFDGQAKNIRIRNETQ
jgi:hypothetical protein